MFPSEAVPKFQTAFCRLENSLLHGFGAVYNGHDYKAVSRGLYILITSSR